MDFFLSAEPNGQSDPFTWSVPIEVLPVTGSCRSAMTEAVACLSSNIIEKGYLNLTTA